VSTTEQRPKDESFALPRSSKDLSCPAPWGGQALGDPNVGSVSLSQVIGYRQPKGRVVPALDEVEDRDDRRQLFLPVALTHLDCYPHEGRCLIDIATESGNHREATVGSRIDIKARRELVRAVSERYRLASKREKRQILDQFVVITGYHRKHSIRLLNSTAGLVAPRQSTRFRVYDEAVREALIVLWEASDRICGKRLKALLPILVPALEKHGHLRLDEAVREKLLCASAATIDRLLSHAKAGVRDPDGCAARSRRSKPTRRTVASPA